MMKSTFLQESSDFLLRLTILGDTPFIDAAELEQVNDLLEEFEAVANDAAGLVYSFIFLPQCMVGIHKPLDALFKRIEILKANSIKFLNLLPFITTDELILGDASVDSLFIVDSLLYDLEELMNRNDGPVVSLKDQIRILHQQLMLSRSLLKKSIKVPPHDSSGIGESRALIRHSAYEAEYLINCFSVGDAPRWYVTMRLTYIIQTNELIWTRLQVIKKNHDLAVVGVAENFRSYVSLQTKRITEFDYVMVGFDNRAIHILDGDDFELGGDDSAMQKILELSYRHLPEYLKPCFLYFGVFLQYRKIHARKLIRLWIAEGFIHKGEGKSAESTGEEYLTELIDKSLVIVSKRRSNGGVKTCMIHDVVYEFCRNMSEQENFLKFAIVRNDYPIYLTGTFGCHARSFHCLPMEKQIYFGNMVQLRVLDFELHPPRSVIGLEYLVQLRYLEITDLPESIGSLVNLEFVIVF
ncbi:hypothetical protein ABFS83_08G084800 [Erythranthe nasuta]